MKALSKSLRTGLAACAPDSSFRVNFERLKREFLFVELFKAAQ